MPHQEVLAARKGEEEAVVDHVEIVREAIGVVTKVTRRVVHQETSTQHSVAVMVSTSMISSLQDS
jgi:hypothetical protein